MLDGKRKLMVPVLSFVELHIWPSRTADLSIPDLSRAEMFVSIRHMRMREVSVVEGLVSDEERCRLASVLRGPT
jgi:hypothetical protein